MYMCVLLIAMRQVFHCFSPARELPSQLQLFDGHVTFTRFSLVCPACPADKRTFYQHNLLKYMTEKRTEAGHTEPLPEGNEPRDPTAEPRLKTPVKQTIYWMFDELDVAPMDRKLSRAEVGSFMNDTKLNVHPRACAESQWSYCDYNNDNYISLSEWCWCTGLDPSKCVVIN